MRTWRLSARAGLLRTAQLTNPVLQKRRSTTSIACMLLLSAGVQDWDSRPDRLWHARQVIAFERLLFRATRGNMFLRTAAVGAVTDPSTTEQQEKSVYVVFFAGERARTKIMKVSLCRVASHTNACTL